MNFVDILIALFVISSVFRGRELGFVRQAFSAAGFFGGLWIGATLIEPHTLHLSQTPTARSVITILTTIGCAFIFLILGEIIGMWTKQRVRRLHIDRVDNTLGSGVAVLSLLAAVWLSAAILVSLPLLGVQEAVRNSAIIGALNRSLPSAPGVIAGIGRLIDPNGFPQVFIGSEPAPPDTPLPQSLGALKAAAQADRASVVKVQGQGCGGIVEGSGFVVGSGLIATNAHVVAGIRSPYVTDAHGTHTATAVWFDPDLDFAVLRVPDLTDKPLLINTDHVSPRAAGAVLGYPGGGGFTAGPASVLDEFTAVGRDIYGNGSTERDVYELKATVIPGNSGGPLINKDGDVIGIVFAESTTYNNVGYALTTSQVVPELHQAEAQNRQVSTGGCAE